MTRVDAIARAAGIDHRGARAVSGISDELLDRIVVLALRGDSAAEIVDALPDVRVRDGYRVPRPLTRADAQAAIGFVAAARRRLRDLDGAIDGQVGAHDRLLAALAPEVPA